MGYKLFIVLIIIGIMTPIWAAFKDFVIENEQDLKRFGLTEGEDTMVDEYLDESYYDLLSYDTCGGGDDALGYGDIDHIFSNYVDGDMGNVGEPGIKGPISREIIKEILLQLAHDPRFKHLKEDKLSVSYTMEKEDQELSSQNYVDYFEEDQSYF